MVFLLGSLLLGFLPFLEQAERGYGYALLLFASVLIGSDLLRKKVAFDLIEIIYSFFLLFAAISTVTSISIARSIKELLLYLAVFVIFVSLRRFDGRKIKLFRNILWIAIFFDSLVLSLLAVLFLLKLNIFRLSVDTMNLFYATAGHNHLAGLLLYTIPIIYTSIYGCSHKLLRKLLFLSILFFLIILVLTYSRMAWLIILLYFIAYILKNYGLVGKKTVYVIAVLFFSLIQLSFLYSFKNEKISWLPENFYKPFVWAELRLDYFYKALQTTKTYPLFGTGLDTYRYDVVGIGRNLQSATEYAHNYLLELLSDSGVLSTLFFSAFLILLLLNIYKKNKQNKNILYFSVLLISLGFLVNNLVDYDWHFLSLFVYFYAIIALIFPVNTTTHTDNRVNKIANGNILIILLLIMLFYFSASFIFGTNIIILGHSLNNNRLISVGSNLLFWDPSSQEVIVQYYINQNDDSRVRKYNDIALKLDKFNHNYIIFRASYEESRKNFDIASQYYKYAYQLSLLPIKESYRKKICEMDVLAAKIKADHADRKYSSEFSPSKYCLPEDAFDND